VKALNGFDDNWTNTGMPINSDICDGECTGGESHYKNRKRNREN
jgi:hypothetical protein